MLRHKKYSEKVATSLSHVDPKNLLPTSATAKFHCCRVFLQLNQWKDTVTCDMLPESWGWKFTGGLRLILTDIAPAPEEFLKIIKCNCTTDCKFQMQLSKAWNEVLHCLWSLSWISMPKCHSFS